MPKKIKNTLPELLSVVCAHEDCPVWLYEGIWRLFNGREQVADFRQIAGASALKQYPKQKQYSKPKRLIF